MEDLKRYTDVPSEMITRREQNREVGTDIFHGGALLPMDASLHPGKYHAGLLARVRESGGVVHGNSAVRHIVLDRQSHTVRFDGFDIRARDVLVAPTATRKTSELFFASESSRSVLRNRHRADRAAGFRRADAEAPRLRNSIVYFSIFAAHRVRTD